MKNFISVVAIVALLIAVTTIQVEVKINNPIGPYQTQRMPLIRFAFGVFKSVVTAMFIAPLFGDDQHPELTDGRSHFEHAPPVNRRMGSDGYQEIDNGEGW